MLSSNFKGFTSEQEEVISAQFFGNQLYLKIKDEDDSSDKNQTVLGARYQDRIGADGGRVREFEFPFCEWAEYHLIASIVRGSSIIREEAEDILEVFDKNRGRSEVLIRSSIEQQYKGQTFLVTDKNSLYYGFILKVIDIDERSGETRLSLGRAIDTQRLNEVFSELEIYFKNDSEKILALMGLREHPLIKNLLNKNETR